MTGAGDAGTGRDRVDVSRVAHNLQPNTGYSAELIATNAAGRSVSDVVSFTTKGAPPVAFRRAIYSMNGARPGNAPGPAWSRSG